jgi:hypothetical protein
MFQQEYEVQKGRTVTCKMGVAHAGAKLTLAHFSGEDEKEKQEKIDQLVEIKSLKLIPLTAAQEEAIKTKAEAEEKARIAGEKRAKEAAEKAEADKAEAEEKARKREAAILEADFDDMNKDPMIQFAKDNEIELKETHAEPIRAELKALQESLTTKDPE